MATYRVTVSTVASFTTTVEADSEEAAEEIGLKRAREWGNSTWSDAGSVDVNGEWQYENPETERVAT